MDSKIVSLTSDYSSEQFHKFDENERSITHIITTNDVNKLNQKVYPKGMDDKEYNGIVLWNHNSDMPIGKSLWRKVYDNRVETKTQFFNDPDAMRIFRLNMSGDLGWWSIGFRLDWNTVEIKEEVWHIPNWSLDEYSNTPTPANINCVNLKNSLKDIENNFIKNDIATALVNKHQENDIEDLKKQLISIKTEFNNLTDTNKNFKAEYENYISETIKNYHKLNSEKLRGIVVDVVGEAIKEVPSLVDNSVNGAISKALGIIK